MRWFVIVLVCVSLIGCTRNATDRWSTAIKLEEGGDHAKAVKVANKALAISLDSLEPARRANLTTSEWSDPAESIGEDILTLTRGLRTKGRGGLYAQRGFLFSTIGEYDLAIGDYDKALASDPDATVDCADAPKQMEIEYLKGLALWQAGDHAPALAILERVSKANPDNQRAYYYLGVIKAASDDQAGAIASLETAAKLEGELPVQEMIEELTGSENAGGILSGTFIIAFFANKEPLSHPFGYIWKVEQ